jgi:hypothetical protein
MMNRDDYLQAVLGTAINPYEEGIAERVGKFVFDSTFLVCGFDDKNMPYVIVLAHPGKATDCTNTGFSAIGAGWEKATAELLYREYKREHGVARVGCTVAMTLSYLPK